MIKFCKNSVDSVLNNITSSMTSDQQRTSIPYGGGGLSILANDDDVPKANINVIERSSLLKEKNKGDDDVEMRGKVEEGDGMGWCTESLGFESYTERSVNEEEYGINDYNNNNNNNEKSTGGVKKKWRNVERRKEKKFPPPLKSLNDNGKPMFVLKPERKDGRLELTEVQIHPQQTLHACRQHGRLRMFLLEDCSCFNQNMHPCPCVSITSNQI